MSIQATAWAEWLSPIVEDYDDVPDTWGPRGVPRDPLCEPDHQQVGLWAAEIIHNSPEGPDNAAIFQDYIEHRLKQTGMYVRRELPCRRSGGRNGRIDLMAAYGLGHVVIELDWMEPRYKSIDKLRGRDAYRIIVLRRDRENPWIHPIAGIDVVVCVPVSKVLDIIRDSAAAHRMMGNAP